MRTAAWAACDGCYRARADRRGRDSKTGLLVEDENGRRLREAAAATRVAERRAVPESGPGVRLTGVLELWRRWLGRVMVR